MEEFDFLKSLGEWVKGAKHTTPDGPVPVVRRGRGDFDSPPPGGLRVTWLGHSTALVEIDGLRLLLDPMWSQRSSPLSWAGPKRFFEPPLALDDLPPLDAVLISHDHFDHLDQATVRILAARGLPFIVPLGVGADLEYWGVASGQVTELEWWQTATVGSLTVTATPARHFSGRSPVMADRDRTLWTGFAIHGPQHRVYYSGDSGMFEGFREIGRRLGPFDIALLEVGAYNRLWADYHLGPEQAVEAALQVRARLMMPVHWATFDLALHSWTEPVERLLTAAADAGLPLSVPRPGQSIEPESPPELVRWWPELPWQTAAQHPIISSGLDPIARTDD
jgi:L-ascorbate metabolism protein UlaG (beta-lactamase superfamily)